MRAALFVLSSLILSPRSVIRPSFLSSFVYLSKNLCFLVIFQKRFRALFCLCSYKLGIRVDGAEVHRCFESNSIDCLQLQLVTVRHTFPFTSHCLTIFNLVLMHFKKSIIFPHSSLSSSNKKILFPIFSFYIFISLHLQNNYTFVFLLFTTHLLTMLLT